MRHSLVSAALAGLLAIAVTASVGTAFAKSAHAQNASAHAPSLRQVDANGLAEETAGSDHPVIVVVTFPDCKACQVAAAQVAAESRRYPKITFVRLDGSELKLSSADGVQIFGRLGAQETFSVKNLTALRGDLSAFISQRAGFAARELLQQSETQKWQAKVGDAGQSFDDRLRDLDTRTQPTLAALDNEALTARNQRSAALKDLTEQMGLLTQQRQSVAGNLPGQLALDTQMKAVQEKIDAQTEQSDAQLKDIAKRRADAQAQSDAEREQITSAKKSATTEAQTNLANATSALAALIQDDRQNASTWH